MSYSIQYCLGTATLKPLIIEWAKEINGDDFDMNIDPNCILADIERLVVSRDADVLLLVHDDEPIGYLGIIISRSPTNGARIANEHHWFVSKAHRGVAAIRLLKAARQWGKDRGCSHIILTASKLASNLHNRTCKLYERLGMQLFETSYIEVL